MTGIFLPLGPKGYLEVGRIDREVSNKNRGEGTYGPCRVGFDPSGGLSYPALAVGQSHPIASAGRMERER